MERSEFRKQLFDLALQNGCTSAETYYEGSDSFSVSVLKGELESYKVSKENGLTLRVTYNGKDGYAYTESFETPEQLVKNAIDNAKVIESADIHPMLGKQEYASVATETYPLSNLSAEEKIDLAKSIEEKVLKSDPRIVRTQGCEVETASMVIELHNTLGMNAARTSNMSAVVCTAIAQDQDVLKDGFAARLNGETDDIDAMVAEATENAIFQLNAAPVPTGTYRVLFKNSAFAMFLMPFMSTFSAEEAQKGRSKLEGKEGTQIASACFTLIDDPFHPRAPRAFDGEGFPTYKKCIIENGVFKTLLHNSKTARKAGVESTGNATRHGSSPVGVGPNVLTIAKGEGSYDQMVEKLENGLVIMELGGLHAGMNPISGDFSLMASGALVENGKIIRAVDRITVAGNFFHLLGDIEAVGADSKFSLYGLVESPSILISSLQIAGE